ncbi:efflux RND transporter periplasmic adaptor subunit [Veronia pacifica]|uniref:Efflux transporter periplasmic adaptor subunit n=1 Tax=Veronia pacifica TaxID=1080227 RepID=A0A1C3EQX8_9GAMM|nr:efflux RND transporter periplasmic adaptor subunit [Veronia pacifica]ODA35602.1 efflux transporter periplasmic adaptor subunit [Veronia pacifica]
MPVNMLRWLLPIIVLSVSIAGYQWMTEYAEDTPAQPRSLVEPSVSTEKAKIINHMVTITSFGEVRSSESTHMSAQVSGVVNSLHPKFVVGGIVSKGEVLFTIDNNDYQAAVLEAEAQLATAKAVLIEEQAKAKVAARQALTMDKVKVTALFLRKPQLLSANARVKSAMAGLSRAKRDLKHCDVLAPYNALVMSRTIGVGQFISKGSQVALLNNVETAEVHVPIPGFDSQFLPDPLEDTEVSITLDNINRQVIRRGEIVRNLGIVDSKTRMTRLVVKLDDPYSINSQLPPIQFGSYVTTSFSGLQLDQVYKVRQEVLTDGKVWVVSDAEKLDDRTVTVIHQSGEYIYIRGDLTPNERLVLTLPDFPQKGMKVNAIPTTELLP